MKLSELIKTYRHEHNLSLHGAQNSLIAANAAQR